MLEEYKKKINKINFNITSIEIIWGLLFIVSSRNIENYLKWKLFY